MSAKKPVELSKGRADLIRERCGKFRILIIGRANAGKTTILQRTCNTTDAPVIYDKNGQQIDTTILDPSQSRGIHDMENEMVFKSNPGFRFHDSCGFEAGRQDEFTKVQDFIDQRSKEMKLENQLHAIWYCIPLDSSRPYTEAENRFFSECNPGKVPVIVIFTKYDALEIKAYGALKQEGCPPDDAKRRAPDKAKEKFDIIVSELSGKRYSPKSYVHLRDMHKEESSCQDLTTRTAAALEDNESLLQMLVTTQRNNLELCIKYALKEVVTKRVRDSKWMEAGADPENEQDSMVSDILNWFAQYRLLGAALDYYLVYGFDYYMMYGYDGAYGENSTTDARTLLSRLDFKSGSSIPAQGMIRLGITTAILADLAYMFWDRRSKAPLLEAIDVYKGQPTHDTIAQAVDELIVRFREHGSYERLGDEIVQIALDNRLQALLEGELPSVSIGQGGQRSEGEAEHEPADHLLPASELDIQGPVTINHESATAGPSLETAVPSKKLAPKKPNVVTRFMRRVFD